MKSVSKKTVTITIHVELNNSFLVDQETFFISVLTSLKNFVSLFNIFYSLTLVLA